VALDLIDAVIATLESVPAVTTAFGYSPGVVKLFSDIVDQVDLPYCQILETGEKYEFMTASLSKVFNFISPGSLLFSITAADRFQTRELGFVIGAALNDAQLHWPYDKLMYFRMSNSQFTPNSDTGPGVPVVFNRVFVFDYTYQGSIG
jgi:hypothetical protein